MDKRIKQIILFLIIIIFILCICIILISGKKDINKNAMNSENQTEPIEQLSEDVVIPRNAYLFFGKYADGKVDAKEIYEKIDNFSKNIVPQYYYELKQSSKEDIGKYYESKENQIREYMRIDSKDEYINFIEQLIKAVSGEKLEIESIEFLNGKIQDTNVSTISELKIKYKNNKDLIMYVKVFKEIQKDNRNVLFYIIGK